MKTFIPVIHVAVVVLAVLIGVLYPTCRTWSAWATGFTIWHAMLSFVLAARPVLEAGRIAGYASNALCLLASLVAVAGYAAGLNWCLVIAVGIGLFASVVTFIIVSAAPFKEASR